MSQWQYRSGNGASMVFSFSCLLFSSSISSPHSSHQISTSDVSITSWVLTSMMAIVLRLVEPQ